MRTYNGHPILTDMPAPRLFKTGNEEAVRISLKYDKSPIGTADIYVHKNCVSHSNGDYIDATYNVLLIDDAYTLYYPMKNKDTGLLELRASDIEFSVEDICEMAEHTKDDYQSHPIKVPRKGLMKKKRGEEFGEWLNVHPTDMLTIDYLT
jgi:hypothetical protein